MSDRSKLRFRVGDHVRRVRQLTGLPVDENETGVVIVMRDPATLDPNSLDTPMVVSHCPGHTYHAWNPDEWDLVR